MPEQDEIVTYESRKARTEAKRIAAAERKVTIRTINRHKLCDKPLESVQTRAEKAKIAQEHREICEKLAKMVVDHQISVKNAASRAGISLRQMYRYVGDEEASRKPRPYRGNVIIVNDMTGKLAQPWIGAGFHVVLVDQCLPQGVNVNGSITTIGTNLNMAMTYLEEWVKVNGALAIIGYHYADYYVDNSRPFVGQCKELGDLTSTPWCVVNQWCEQVAHSESLMCGNSERDKILDRQVTFDGIANWLFNRYHTGQSNADTQ